MGVIFPKKELLTIKCQKANANEKIVNLVYYIFKPVGHDYSLEPTSIFFDYFTITSNSN